MSFIDKRAALNQTLKSGVWHLEALGMTRLEIAREIGYKDAAMIGQVMSRDDALFGPVQLVEFFRLCCSRGYHAPREHGIPADYRVIPAPDVHEPNGCVRDEVVHSVEATGAASVEYGLRRFAAVRQHGERLILAGWSFIREAEHAEHAPTVWQKNGAVHA